MHIMPHGRHTVLTCLSQQIEHIAMPFGAFYTTGLS